MLERLFAQFDSLVVLDTETTGVRAESDEIIELAALRCVPDGAQCRVDSQMDEFIFLSPGRKIPPQIVSLTGITDRMLQEQGIEKRAAAERFAALFTPRTLLVAYNAQFDLCFLYYFLSRFGMAGILKQARLLDALTVYKDRRDYPHKLCSAIEAYQLKGQNTHRAIDDALATLELLQAMEQERGDLHEYVNLFGFNPKFGAPKPRIGSVTYLPQPYTRTEPLYMKKPAGSFL